jgi:hypothetical protein
MIALGKIRENPMERMKKTISETRSTANHAEGTLLLIFPCAVVLPESVSSSTEFEPYLHSFTDPSPVP